MKEQAVKLQKVERELSDSKGQFELFALFLREDAPNRWDLLISADWVRSDKKGSINFILQEIKKVLNDQEIIMLSRIIILDEKHDAMRAFHGGIHVEHGLVEVSNSNFLGLAIKYAYIITSQCVNSK